MHAVSSRVARVSLKLAMRPRPRKQRALACLLPTQPPWDSRQSLLKKHTRNTSGYFCQSNQAKFAIALDTMRLRAEGNIR
ncbi:hypothetical protein HUW63_01030 [Myxococcus sp. AM001]|nr:hypothetical protein [Myxococcus sp. AM001]